MLFDIIIGNPPYQIKNKGNNPNKSSPLYHKFVELSIKLKPNYVIMVIPSRYMTGGQGLDDFRQYMLNCNNLSYIKDFTDSKSLFKDVDIRGGVNYFLWDKHYNGQCNYNGVMRQLNEYDIFVRDNDALTILDKVLNYDG